MHVSAEHLEIAARLDAKVQRLLGLGYHDLAIFVEMADDMPDFKRLLDAGRLLMDELCGRFYGFYAARLTWGNVALETRVVVFEAQIRICRRLHRPESLKAYADRLDWRANRSTAK